MKYTAVFVLFALVASAYSATLPEAEPQLAPEAAQEIEPKDAAAAPAEQARDKRGLIYSPWVSPYASAYSYYPYSYSSYSYHPVAYSAWAGYRPYYPAYYSPYIVG
ncbi:hypothetical protein QAD02_008679 [Eretmocerus hayati]|uniref:Uncharacterized protein n=1 Tax=Eretmocerus hayati TaxID=131215 RepID=A0ACC2N9K0_9HYME|nr:hypothetical protein QAD02_008679 [Eretmocerus hayati]